MNESRIGQKRGDGIDCIQEKDRTCAWNERRSLDAHGYQSPEVQLATEWAHLGGG